MDDRMVHQSGRPPLLVFSCWCTNTRKRTKQATIKTAARFDLHRTGRPHLRQFPSNTNSWCGEDYQLLHTECIPARVVCLPMLSQFGLLELKTVCLCNHDFWGWPVEGGGDLSSTIPETPENSWQGSVQNKISDCLVPCGKNESVAWGVYPLDLTFSFMEEQEIPHPHHFHQLEGPPPINPPIEMYWFWLLCGAAICMCSTSNCNDQFVSCHGFNHRRVTSTSRARTRLFFPTNHKTSKNF